MNSKMTFAATSLLLAGALAVTYGCASSEDNSAGGSSGNSSSQSGAGNGGAGNGGAGNGGGAGSSGSTTTPTPSGDSITFNEGAAKGLFSGYGWVALGKDDSLTSPSCDTNDPITVSTPCKTSTVWSKKDALCMSGKIPALPASPVQADYDNNWGVQIGVNFSEPNDAAGDTLSKYTSVTFSLAGSPSTGLRAMLHRKGDPDGTTYCADNIKSGTAIKLATFNTKCWGETSTVMFKVPDDLKMVDKIGVQVSSTSKEISVSDLCLSQVDFK